MHATNNLYLKSSALKISFEKDSLFRLNKQVSHLSKVGSLRSALCFWSYFIVLFMINLTI